ncbi:MAG: hypothetical protein V4450_06280 [Bacteroidota bacterium]
MTYNYPSQSYLSKTVLAGVFAGIVATLANLGYDFFFRTLTQFVPAQIINVATIIFATMLLCTVAGLLYFFVSKFVQKGALVYVIVLSLVTFSCMYLSMQATRSADPGITANFRVLLLGIVTISGGLVTLFIPYLMKHQSIFLDEHD